MVEPSRMAREGDGKGPEQWTLWEVVGLLFSKLSPFGRVRRNRRGRLLDRYGRPLH